MSLETLDACLFADLPGERRIQAPPDSLSPLEVGLRTNLWLAQGFVRRATELRLELKGNTRAVVRLARLRGLIAAIERAPARSGDDVILRASGPLALFRRTLVYGRALASLVPVLSWCQRFRLTATCVLDDGAVPIEVRSGDRDRRRRWLLEIVGFWTPEYLEHKLRALRRANRKDLIVCVDGERNCSAGELPAKSPVIRFRKKIDLNDVLELIEDRRP